MANGYLLIVLLLLPMAHGFNYYDDFDSLNSKVWLDDNNVFDIVDGQLQCNPDGVQLRFLEFLPYQDFNKNDWTIEYEVVWQDTYASHIAGFAKDKELIQTPGETYQFFGNYREGTPNIDLYFYEKVNGKSFNSHYMQEYLPGYTGIYRYEKTNLRNGHFNMKMYRDGVLQVDMDSQNNWQSRELRGEANKMLIWCNFHDNNDWRIDWLYIAVKEDKNVCKQCGSDWKPRTPVGVPEFSFAALFIVTIVGTVGLILIRRN